MSSSKGKVRENVGILRKSKFFFLGKLKWSLQEQKGDGAACDRVPGCGVGFQYLLYYKSQSSLMMKLRGRDDNN